jgi:SAM-dependent methyltransferase
MPADPNWRQVIDADAPHLGGNIRFGDPETYSPSVWDFVIDRFGVRSVLDLGSGVGNAACYFARKGLHVVAVDGLRENVENAIYPTFLCDLTQGPVTTRVDLVHCQEVVEHIEEAYLDNLLNSLMCGKYILMTNALPGQGGHHHVNLQPTEYWIDHLVRRGCQLLALDSNRVRALAQADGAPYLATTGILLANGRRF